MRRQITYIALICLLLAQISTSYVSAQFSSSGPPLPLSTQNGGTGTSTSSVTNGQIPIGSTATGKYAPATLTAGTNITITNGANSILIDAASGGTGVTSAVAGTGISVSGATGAVTISTDGTMTIAGSGGLDYILSSGNTPSADVAVKYYNPGTTPVIAMYSTPAGLSESDMVYFDRNGGTLGGYFKAVPSIATDFTIIYNGTTPIWQAQGVGSQFPSNSISTNSGSSSGTLDWSQPFRGVSKKEVIANLVAFDDAGETLTFPVAFARTPVVVANNTGLIVTVSTTQLTIPNTIIPVDGTIILGGR